MISFRYHVVSLVAVFLALALGIVVGTTALNGPITDDLRKRVDAANTSRDQLAAQLQTTKNRATDSDAFIAQYGGLAVRDLLKGEKVLVVALPDANSGVVDGVGAQLTAAGGTVSGRVRMTADFFATARAADIKSLVTSGNQPSGLTLPSTDDAVALGGALLAYVLTGKGSSTDLAQTVSSFSTLQMLQVEGAPPAPADLVVLVGTGNPADVAVATSEATFAGTFQQAGATAVVAGDTAADTAPGVITSIRANGTLAKTVSTVDDADTAMGRVSTVLALAARPAVGAYGSGTDADSPYPKPTS